jgi:hypothetical protein
MYSYVYGDEITKNMHKNSLKIGRSLAFGELIWPHVERVYTESTTGIYVYNMNDRISYI